MGKAKRIKSAAAGHPVPQSKADAESAIAEIGQHQRERERIQAAMNDELAAIKQKHEEQAAPHNEAIRELSQGVQTWAEANRVELTGGGKTKTAALASGELRWRMRPPKVALRSVEAVIEALKQLKLSRFVRVKEEVNKEAILAEPEAVEHVKGITITQGEDFVIVPFETRLEEVA